MIVSSLALTLIGAAIAPGSLNRVESVTAPEPKLAASIAAQPAESPPPDTLQAKTEVAQIEKEVAAVVEDMPDTVRHAIDNATRMVGVDAHYLTVVAARESGFDPEAHAPHTSASGLYQFTAGTWLRAVKMFGARRGLGDYADLITLGDDGVVSMPAGAAREELLKLRSDPELAALMAAELTRDNALRLGHILGRRVTPAETYMAHLFGVVPAARMIDAAHSAPHVVGAELLPTAARANPRIFNASGVPASARDIVARIGADFRRGASHSGASI